MSEPIQQPGAAAPEYCARCRYVGEREVAGEWRSACVRYAPRPGVRPTWVRPLIDWCGEFAAIDASRARVWPKDIIAEVAHRYDLTADDLAGPSRKKRISHPRQEAMWELRQRTSLSLPHIGKFLGGRDHTTVLHGVRAYERRAGLA